MKLKKLTQINKKCLLIIEWYKNKNATECCLLLILYYEDHYYLDHIACVILRYISDKCTSVNTIYSIPFAHDSSSLQIFKEHFFQKFQIL